MPTDEKRLKVLLLCTGESYRSQMTEGWTRALKSGVIDPGSAGTTPKGVDPRAIQVMAEEGVDLSRQTSKSLESLGGIHFDYAITLCGDPPGARPLYSGARKTIHAGFTDPPALATRADTDEEALAVYRRVRDEFRTFIEKMPDNLLEENGSIAGTMRRSVQWPWERASPRTRKV
jgi:arsenate reductase